MKNPLVTLFSAAAFAVVAFLGSPADAAPPNKVPGTGYFDGDLSKAKDGCNSCCKKSKRCDSKAKSKNCCAKTVSTRPDSSKNDRKPYWKRKTR